jgi:hypothetical protein
VHARQVEVEEYDIGMPAPHGFILGLQQFQAGLRRLRNGHLCRQIGSPERDLDEPGIPGIIVDQQNIRRAASFIDSHHLHSFQSALANARRLRAPGVRQARPDWLILGQLKKRNRAAKITVC